MGATRVDLLHLLEALRDAYAGSLEESILIKLGLLACADVVTETRRGKTHVATTWRLASRHRAPWNWTAPPGLVGVCGTAVRLRLQNALSPLVDAGFLERTLRCHFQPLFETAFDSILARAYPSSVTFVVNGRALARGDIGPTASLAVRVGRQRMPSAVGYLERPGAPLPADAQGVAVS